MKRKSRMLRRRVYRPLCLKAACQPAARLKMCEVLRPHTAAGVGGGVGGNGAGALCVVPLVPPGGPLAPMPFPAPGLRLPLSWRKAKGKTRDRRGRGCRESDNGKAILRARGASGRGGEKGAGKGRRGEGEGEDERGLNGNVGEERDLKCKTPR